jgi:hypothetical protein
VIVGQEQLLQVGLLRQQVDDRVPGGGLEQPIRAALQPAAQDGAVDGQVVDPWQPGEVVGGDRGGEADLHAAQRPFAQRLDALHGHQPALADDADAVGDVLHLREDVGRHEHGLAALARLPDHHQELLLHQRVQAAGRLVQDQQLRCVHERLHQADLLPVALREAADPGAQLQVEPAGQLLDAAGGDATTEVAQVGERLADRLAPVDGELAGQVADTAPQRGAARPRPGAQHPDLAAAGPDQVQQQPDGGGLAGAVGAEVAEHLARPDLQVQTVEPTPAPVRLCQPLGADHRLVARAAPGHRGVLTHRGLLVHRGTPLSSRYRSQRRRNASPKSSCANVMKS